MVLNVLKLTVLNYNLVLVVYFFASNMLGIWTTCYMGRSKKNKKVNKVLLRTSVVAKDSYLAPKLKEDL